MPDVKREAVTEWVGDFKLMAGLLAEIEESAHHNNDTKDWSDRLCDCAFFAQRVAHVMLDLQPKHLELLAALRGVLASPYAGYAFTNQTTQQAMDCAADFWNEIERCRSLARAAVAKAEGR